MARFAGYIGYGTQTLTAPGVWEDTIVRRKYYGDILRVARSLSSPEKVLSDISVSNQISIVADAYANGHIFDMRFVEWAGARWVITNVDVQRPRLILTIGGVYNGPTGEASGDPGVDSGGE